MNKKNITDCFNLGANKGYSVKEIIKICQEVVNKKIDIEIKEKREGDPLVLIADNTKASNIINWKPKRNLKESIKNAYNYLKGL